VVGRSYEAGCRVLAGQTHEFDFRSDNPDVRQGNEEPWDLSAPLAQWEGSGAAFGRGSWAFRSAATRRLHRDRCVLRHSGLKPTWGPGERRRALLAILHIRSRRRGARVEDLAAPNDVIDGPGLR